jgi:predicted deacylase
MSTVLPLKICDKIILPGECAHFNLTSYRLPISDMLDTPVYVFRSLKPGPIVLLQGGMHGNETNGVEIVRQLVSRHGIKNPIKGTIIAIPILNIAGFIAGTRDLPDGRDLNRCFPGSKNGSLGSRIAYSLTKEILSIIDLGIDFHTGGEKINNYPQIRCSFEDAKALEYAKVFHPPFILNSTYREKSFRREAAKINKPILVYEAGESLRFTKLAVEQGVHGSLRLLNHLGVCDIAIPKVDHTIILSSTSWIRARKAGLFRTTKKYGSYIEKDEIIGTISDPYGEKEYDLKAPSDGFLIAINNKPVVNEGDALIHIGIEK